MKNTKLIRPSLIAVAVSLAACDAPPHFTAAVAAGSPAASGSCSEGALDARLDVDSAWDGGFCANIRLTNSSPSAVEGWYLDFDLDCSIAIGAAWEGTFTRQGQTVHVEPTWNK